MNILPKSDTQRQRGFTIVELLIVIVIIGILASLVIVAYNGIQNRAKSQSAEASAVAIQKKIEAYNAVGGLYPADATNALYTTTLNSLNESSIAASGVTLGTPTAANGQKTVKLSRCTAGTTGYRIEFWDYATGALDTVPISGVSSGTCTTWTALT